MVSRISLVAMPWAPVHTPSLALGVLSTYARRHVPDISVESVYANIDFVDWVGDRIDFDKTGYLLFSQRTYVAGCGEWVFSSALYGDPRWRLKEYIEAFEGKLSASELDLSIELHQLAPTFVEYLAERILESDPEIVGFTSSLQQNTATLAAARQIKRVRPDVRIVLGGANCDGDQGVALHRNFPFVDFVVRGEGERALRQLVDASRTGSPLFEIGGLCWRDADGQPVVNPMNRAALPPAELVEPDFTSFFERLGKSRASDWAQPWLGVEGSRGCWWGEKRICTFCGINGSSVSFRSKDPEALHNEIVDLARRHRVLDLLASDSILDHRYIATLLPRIAASGYDLRFHYEIKSNMQRRQLQALADAGLVFITPGIENLSGAVLEIMRKGVTGCQNVRLLRDAESVGVTLHWNYLYGFPGETDADYEPVVTQLPALHHLSAACTVTAIAILRFSPYFDDPTLGFAGLRPVNQYRMIYDLPESELKDLAYLFGFSARGISREMATRLRAAVGEWHEAYVDSRLTYHDLGNEILLVSRRRYFDWETLRLTTPLEVAAFRGLENPVTAAGLTARVSAEVPAVDVAAIESLLRTWRGLGILFEDAGEFVHVVPEAMNQDLLKITRTLTWC